MDTVGNESALKELGPGYVEAGAEYLSSIKALGLDPEGLFWAVDSAIGGHVLVLVTRMFDYAGPLALSQTMFKAYNASATPKAITPFIVRMHSPKHSVIRALVPFLSAKFDPALHRLSKAEGAKLGVGIDEQIQGSDLTFRPEWIYKFELNQGRRSVTPDRETLGALYP